MTACHAATSGSCMTGWLVEARAGRIHGIADHQPLGLPAPTQLAGRGVTPHARGRHPDHITFTLSAGQEDEPGEQAHP
jgi:hypothetical protein